MISLTFSLKEFGIILKLSNIVPVNAATNVAFVSGGFRRSVSVESIEHLAKTGEAKGVLKDLLKFGSQDPKHISNLLNQETIIR